MIHAYSDPLAEFTAVEAGREDRRATAISQMEGRAVDSFGFAHRPVSPLADRPRAGMPRTVLDRATRLWIARTIAADRAAAAEIRQRAMQAFECPPVREVMSMAELMPELYQQLFGAKNERND